MLRARAIAHRALRHVASAHRGAAAQRRMFLSAPAPAQSVQKHGTDEWVSSLQIAVRGHSSRVDPFRLVASDLEEMTRAVRETVSVLQHPVLDRCASHLLSLHGKRIRPIIVILMGRAAASTTTSSSTAASPPILSSQLRLAEITEMIHAASLLHDDVIDTAESRRGLPSVNSVFGNQLAVLAGDFLLARASVALARLRDCDVVELLSTVIEHLVRGEVIQMNGGTKRDAGGIGDASDEDREKHRQYHQPEGRFESYMAKTFFKTASLIANSCRAVTLLAGHEDRIADAAYTYGEHLGIAFQLIDDVLDYTSSTSALGKPVLNDLRQGQATAPILFALDAYPDQVAPLIDRRFQSHGDVDTALKYVYDADGISKTQQLARKHARIAVAALCDHVAPSDARSALVNIADIVLTRKS